VIIEFVLFWSTGHCCDQISSIHTTTGCEVKYFLIQTLPFSEVQKVMAMATSKTY
jgi:hypothetical protein